VKRARIAGWHDVAGIAVFVNPPDTRPEIGADDGLASRHRFELHHTKGLLARHRRQHEHIARAIQRGELVIFNGTQEPHLIRDVERVRLLSQLRTQWSLPHDERNRIQPLHCLE
jgi:hypothetical protein